MSQSTRTGPSPSDEQSPSPRTDVTDPDDLRCELIRIAEDADAGDLQTAEGRVTTLLSDFRRAIRRQKRGGDD
jgi:hypothetical protein